MDGISIVSLAIFSGRMSFHISIYRIMKLNNLTSFFISVGKFLQECPLHTNKGASLCEEEHNWYT